MSGEDCQSDGPLHADGLSAEAKYRLLLDLSREVRGTLDLGETLDRLLDSVRAIVEYDAAGITGRQTYVNCGHVPPLLVGEDIAEEELSEGGPVLGVRGKRRWSRDRRSCSSRRGRGRRGDREACARFHRLDRVRGRLHARPPGAARGRLTARRGIVGQGGQGGQGGRPMSETACGGQIFCGTEPFPGSVSPFAIA